MTYRLFLWAWLVAVWVALWRDVSLANLASGAVLAAGAIMLFPPPNEGRGLQVRLVPLLRFLGTAIWATLKANLVVAWQVITPADRINEGVVTVEVDSTNPVVITMISHAVILAPGTMVIDADLGDDDRPTMLFVHVLHLRSVDAVREEVQTLERLARAAVEGATA